MKDLVEEVETIEEGNLGEGIHGCQMLVCLAKKDNGPKEHGGAGLDRQRLRTKLIPSVEFN